MKIHFKAFSLGHSWVGSVPYGHWWNIGHYKVVWDVMLHEMKLSRNAIVESGVLVRKVSCMLFQSVSYSMVLYLEIQECV